MNNLAEIKKMALYAASRTAPTNYTIENIDEALRGELSKMCSSINDFMRNKYDIYEIIIETADEIVPKRVIDRLSMFAEVRVVPQGQKTIFKRKIGKNRAKKFLTQVGLSGVYETFRLDTQTFEVPVHAVGGAGTIDFERFLDGEENMADIMEIITDGLEDAVYYEIMACLKAAYNVAERPEANQYYENGFFADKMQKLINVVKAYGTNAVIFAAPEFIAEMGPDAIVPGTANYQGVYSPKDIEEIHDRGLISIFRGTPIVQIPQSFIDETNTKTTIDPRYAFVFPTGDEKIVKVAIEGQTQIYDFKNRDNSMEIHTYRKIGAAIMSQHNWGIYVNTAIEDTFDNPYGF